MNAFVWPAAFWALVAIAVPVVLHLAAARERQGAPFPSLRFLQQVEVRRTRRKRLRDPWLLLLRVLALAAIVAAFAEPLFEGGATDLVPTSKEIGRAHV